MMKGPASAAFVPGPPIEPADSLLEWLENEAGPKGTQVRLPVALRLQRTLGLSVKEAVVAVSAAAISDTSLRLKLDDSMMGMPLSMTLSGQSCDDAGWCALWLEGYWGSDLDDLDFALPGRANTHSFSVRRVGDPVDVGAQARAFVEMEGTEASEGTE